MFAPKLIKTSEAALPASQADLSYGRDEQRALCGAIDHVKSSVEVAKTLLTEIDAALARFEDSWHSPTPSANHGQHPQAIPEKR